MFVYGVCAGPNGKFERIAGPSIERVRKADDELVVLYDQPSIFVAYNGILDRAAECAHLEGIVLIHDDVELLDEHLASKLRATFADETIGVVGVVGARAVQSLEWWGYDTRGRVKEDRSGVIDFGGGDHDVEVIDGLFMALSPWAARRLRFDEGYGGFHGYDADFCLAVRAHGRRVVVRELDVVHRTVGGYGDKDAFDAADRRFRRKWGLTPPPPRERRRAGRLRRRQIGGGASDDVRMAGLVRRVVRKLASVVRRPVPTVARRSPQ